MKLKNLKKDFLEFCRECDIIIPAKIKGNKIILPDLSQAKKIKLEIKENE